MKQASVSTGTSRYIIIISTLFEETTSMFSRSTSWQLYVDFALWFSTYIDVIEVQVDLFIVFGVQVAVSIVLGIQVDRFIDYGV